MPVFQGGTPDSPPILKFSLPHMTEPRDGALTVSRSGAPSWVSPSLHHCCSRSSWRKASKGVNRRDRPQACQGRQARIKEGRVASGRIPGFWEQTPPP